MEPWRFEQARERIHNFEALSPKQQRDFLAMLNCRYPPAAYEEQCARLDRALAHAHQMRTMLACAAVEYPPTIGAGALQESADALRGCALALTAGGEGERLRLSLLRQGISSEQLRDFTKATFPIPGLPCGYGPLQANLLSICRLARAAGCDVPVVITVGPAGSSTARIIPRLLAEQGNFGLPHLRVIEQDERLHLTADRKIAYRIENGAAVAVTNPDETGGPLMKLRAPDPLSGRSVLDWLSELGCRTVIVLQATAVYDPSLIVKMAAAAKRFDAVGVGIPRSHFPPDDPYGSFVFIRDSAISRLMIVEQGWRFDAMRAIRDPTGAWHLPYNTGFYAFDARLLREQSLPDYCTLPKEVLPGLARAPKTGYAATDLLPRAAHAAVLTIAPESFAVLKSVDDLPLMADVWRRYNAGGWSAQ